MQSIDSGFIVEASGYASLVGYDDNEIISSVQRFDGFYCALDPGEVLRAMKVCDVRVEHAVTVQECRGVP
jgi:hypothetical protein